MYTPCIYTPTYRYCNNDTRDNVQAYRATCFAVDGYLLHVPYDKAGRYK